MHFASPSADGIVIVSDVAAVDPARFAKFDSKAVTAIHNSVLADAKLRACGSLVPARLNTTLIYIGSDVWIGCKATALRGTWAIGL